MFTKVFTNLCFCECLQNLRVFTKLFIAILYNNTYTSSLFTIDEIIDEEWLLYVACRSRVLFWHRQNNNLCGHNYKVSIVLLCYTVYNNYSNVVLYIIILYAVLSWGARVVPLKLEIYPNFDTPSDNIIKIQFLHFLYWNT